MFFVLAMALAAFAAPALAQSAMIGSGGVDILGQGIFETGAGAFKFPAMANANYDSIDVGNDRAMAIGAGVGPGIGLLGANFGTISATNHLKIKKNQDSGDAQTCSACSPKYNIEQVKVGSRAATAIGAGVGKTIGGIAFNAGGVSATNDVEIVTNQQ
ncbi:MAG TPA: hypothetical protein PKV33_08925 [Methanothrix sp.]|nr:hypothetical protein [Methanothrix sp.]